MTTTLILSSLGAGFLTILSPCILPLVPFVARSTVQKNKFAPIFLALGLITTFSLTTFAIAKSGSLFGLDNQQIKSFSGVILLLASLLFIFPSLNDKISSLLAPITTKFDQLGRQRQDTGLFSSFFTGLTLGPIWTPCSGPTLAIIISMISSQASPLNSFILLSLFAIGTLVPILLISYGSKEIMNKLMSASKIYSKGKLILGIFCFVFSILIITGVDKTIEAQILNILPDFIIEWSVKI